MFPDDTLNLGAYVEITGKVEGEEMLVHSGDITCRKLEKGDVWYYIKQQRGKTLWFTHGEVIGTRDVNGDTDLVEREQIVESKQWSKRSST